MPNNGRPHPILAHFLLLILWPLAGPLAFLRLNFCNCLPHRVAKDIKQNNSYQNTAQNKLCIIISQVSIFYQDKGTLAVIWYVSSYS